MSHRYRKYRTTGLLESALANSYIMMSTFLQLFLLTIFFVINIRFVFQLLSTVFTKYVFVFNVGSIKISVTIFVLCETQNDGHGFPSDIICLGTFRCHTHIIFILEWSKAYKSCGWARPQAEKGLASSYIKIIEHRLTMYYNYTIQLGQHMFLKNLFFIRIVKTLKRFIYFLLISENFKHLPIKTCSF